MPKAIFLLIVLTASILLPSYAYAEKRVAMVIGNGAYTKVAALPNPSRDANAMAGLLRSAGFDVVETKNDLSLPDMRRSLRNFSDQVRDADIAVVFYAGHGIEVNGFNFLIPVDATLERDMDVEDEAVSLERVTQVLEQAKRLRLVILDACRDNPFVRSMKRTMTGRSIGRGLAEVRVLTSDTIIAFAAKAGSTAADGEGLNSPYTFALVKHLATPGLDLRLALGRVRDDVLKSTGNRQEPFLYGSLGGGEIALVSAPKTQEEKRDRSNAPASEAAEVWDRVKDTSSVTVLGAFMARYSDSFYAELAKERIADLRKRETAAAKALEGKAEERKREEDAARRKAADEASKAADVPKPGKSNREVKKRDDGASKTQAAKEPQKGTGTKMCWVGQGSNQRLDPCKPGEEDRAAAQW